MSNNIKTIIVRRTLYATVFMLVWFVATNSYGQVEIEFENKESIFITLDLPNDSIWRKLEVASLHLGAYIQIDTNGFVNNLLIYPLYSLGNDLPTDHPIWKHLERDIEVASKKWQFKPILFDVEGASGDSIANSSVIWRPFLGTQSHFVILSFYPNFFTDTKGLVFQKMYEMQISPSKKIFDRN